MPRLWQMGSLSAGVRAHEGVPVVSSRDVADRFEKQHAHVLRDVDAILHAPNLEDGHRQWFIETATAHPTISGRMDRAFDLTRQGFTAPSGSPQTCR